MTVCSFPLDLACCGMMHTYVLPERVLGRLCGQLVMGGLAGVLSWGPPRERGEPRALDGASKCALGCTVPVGVLTGGGKGLLPLLAACDEAVLPHLIQFLVHQPPEVDGNIACSWLEIISGLHVMSTARRGVRAVKGLPASVSSDQQQLQAATCGLPSPADRWLRLDHASTRMRWVQSAREYHMLGNGKWQLIIDDKVYR